MVRRGQGRQLLKVCVPEGGWWAGAGVCTGCEPTSQPRQEHPPQRGSLWEGGWLKVFGSVFGDLSGYSSAIRLYSPELYKKFVGWGKQV